MRLRGKLITTGCCFCFFRFLLYSITLVIYFFMYFSYTFYTPNIMSIGERVNVLSSHLSVKKHDYNFVKITFYLRTRFRRKEQSLNLELQNQLLRVLVEPEQILHVQLDPCGVPLKARYQLVLLLPTILHG